MQNTIRYSINPTELEGLELSGFFEGWPNKPDTAILRESIENADFCILAVDDAERRLVGYITALTDGVLSAYIPFLEVHTDYQNRGIGKQLVTRLLDQLNHLYMIDLVCDKEIASFYEEAGFRSWHAMIKRNYANQAGAKATN